MGAQPFSMVAWSTYPAYASGLFKLGSRLNNFNRKPALQTKPKEVSI